MSITNKLRNLKRGMGKIGKGLCGCRLLLDRQSSGSCNLARLNILFRFLLHLEKTVEVFSHVFGNTSVSNWGAREEG